jgi:uroporphyrinogen decarboxylase
MTETLQNDLLLKAARREPVERAPVWFMRQAGRYLPEYRAVRAQHSFLEMVRTPELAAEVTIQPVDLVGVDAAIIFSDILVIPEAMGMNLVVEEGKGGPRFPDPIRLYKQIKSLKEPNVKTDLGYVTDAIRLTKERLAGRVPLIGFSGAPWTLLAYMVEGSGSKDFRYAKQMLFTRPDEAHLLLQKLTDAIAQYLIAQVEAGANVVQIFDTWAGILTPDDFREFSLEYIGEIVRLVKLHTHNVPVIVFCKGANQNLTDIAATGCDVIGLDWTVDISEVKALLGGSVTLQGNLDPALLYTSEEVLDERVRTIAERMGDPVGHIFNLGHGITPEVDPDMARAFVRAAKNAYALKTA